MTLTDLTQRDEPEMKAHASTTIFVCITCRRAGDAEDDPRPGARLADATIRAAAETDVTVRRVRCLANCNRACSAAVRREDAWTYVFGELDPETGGADLVEGARLFAQAQDGLMPWRGRPAALKRGLIARVPPIDFEGETE